MISFIIPTLNEESIIEKTLSQVTPELIDKYGIELIVSDGGSTDETVELARKRANLVLTNGYHGRQTIAEGRNLGARNSSGDVLFFINADVRVGDMGKYLSAMFEAIQDPRVAAATCPVSIYPEEEKFVDLIFHKFNNLHIWILSILGLGTGRGECHVVKREKFFAVGGYDESLAAGEDFDLYWRLSKIGKIRFVGTVKVYESPRRYREWGYFRVATTWLLNALSTLFLRRSFSKEWKPVR